MSGNIKTKEERAQEEESPYHARWKVLFNIYSWWRSMDKRTFVICQRWSNRCGQLEFIEILETDNEHLKVIPYSVFFEEFKRGMFTKTSVGSLNEHPPLPGKNLWPDRVY